MYCSPRGIDSSVVGARSVNKCSARLDLHGNARGAAILAEGWGAIEKHVVVAPVLSKQPNSIRPCAPCVIHPNGTIGGGGRPVEEIDVDENCAATVRK